MHGRGDGTLSKTKEWDRVRKQLKIEFERRDIVRCERCSGSFGLSFAHRLKRRFITTDEELRTVALLCQQCHYWAEYGDRDNPGTHERMYEIITEIIDGRSSKAGQEIE